MHFYDSKRLNFYIRPKIIMYLLIRTEFNIKLRKAWGIDHRYDNNYKLVFFFQLMHFILPNFILKIHYMFHKGINNEGISYRHVISKDPINDLRLATIMEKYKDDS